MTNATKRRRVLGTLAVLAVIFASGFRPDRSAAEVEARYGTPPSRFVRIGGVRTHLRDEGQGRPLVLIHGTSSSLHTWDGWVRSFRGTRRVIRFDLPGFGLTGPAPDRDYSAARYARFVTQVLDELHVERADIAGNSLGGRVAAEVAIRHPGRVRKLILIDAAGLSGNRMPLVFALAKSPFTRWMVTSMTPRFIYAKSLRDVYADDDRITDALVDRYYALSLREGNRRALVDRFTRPNDGFLDERLGSIHAPTFIQWGERDVWIPLTNAARFAHGISNARVHVYAAGHVPMEEIPDATARDAAAFLDAP